MGYRWLVLIGQELDGEALVQPVTNKNLRNFYWHFCYLIPYVADLLQFLTLPCNASVI